MDTKKKELLGNLYRDGSLYTLEAQQVFDHDFPHLADGIVILHSDFLGIEGALTINLLSGCARITQPTTTTAMTMPGRWFCFKFGI